MSSVNLVSKLTIKTMGAQPPKNSVEEKTMLATIYGRCTAKKPGTSDYGEYIRFKGEFEGVNAFDGKVYRSATMIVPKTLEELLDVAIKLDEANAVDFAVEVWVEPSERSITGYTYIIKPLTEPEESDVLASLRQLAAPSNAKQLDAPKQVAKK